MSGIFGGIQFDDPLHIGMLLGGLLDGLRMSCNGIEEDIRGVCLRHTGLWAWKPC